MRVVILLNKKRGDLSAINKVVFNFIPYLEKRINVKWKVCAGISAGAFLKQMGESLRINGPALKLPIITVFTFFRFFFDKDIRKCQIINAHGADSWIPAILLSKFLNKISLITLHETEDYIKESWFYGGGKIAGWLWRWTVKNADYLTDVSGILKIKKSFYVPNGINLNEFKPKPTVKEEKVVLFVGRLRHQKGIEYFIKASQLIKKELKEKIKFIVIAAPRLKVPEEKKYIKLIKENKIELHFNVSFNKISEYYQKADVLILPSVNEAFGLVLLEAMACGVPVIASNVGGVSKVVKNGVVGFLTPVGDSQLIAEKALMILNNKDLKKEMSKNCLEWVKQFSWENIADEYEKVYYKILDNLNK